MDPITLIVTALVAGATAGGLDTVQDGAKAGIKVAYEKLHGLVRKHAAGNAGAEVALAEIEADPETWKSPLAAKLTQLGAAGDADLVAAAETLMELVDGAGARAGQYHVTIKGSRGVQVGDGNIQVNRF
jgi:hypothetical protein